MRLSNKRIVITGGSRGLGRALATRFTQEGARIALCARSLDDLKRTALELASLGAPPLFAACDVADARQVEQFADLVLGEFGAVDVLINNAALLGTRSEIVEWTRPAWDRVMDVNISGVFSVTKAFLPSMILQRSGSIINVSSSVGKSGKPRWGAYAVSKFALEGFTQVLSAELVSSGIRVNSVNPGAIDTQMRHAAYPHEQRSELKPASEATDVFVYLASDESRGITGRCLEAQEFTRIKKETS